MVNGPDDVYVEREGRIERVEDRLFEGEESVLHLIERIVGPLGLRVDQASPWVDARLPGGSRVHAIVPPLSLRGPVLTIRTFAPVPLSGEDIVAQGSIGPRALRFLAACVRGRANLVVSGGSGQRQDDLARRPVGLHPGRGAPGHDRRCGRAPPASSRTSCPRSEAAERRGTRSGDGPRPRPQRAPHAARPDHRRRGPGR